MRDRRHTDGHVQSSGQFCNVVDVGRCTGDMQMGRFVDVRHADNAGTLSLQLVLVSHGVHFAPPSLSHAQTETSWAGSGSSGRVSSQKRRSRLRDTSRR